MLWAKSAGRCAYPACPNRCIDSFETSGTILIGEMAHVLAHGKKGPRASGRDQGQIDTYENLVLLCPYHHTVVDKAPRDFPTELLEEWKHSLEERVDQAIDTPVFAKKTQLFEYAAELLNQNKFIHDNFGPLSVTALDRPLSNLHTIWEAKKIEELIPNNSLVAAAFRRYRRLLTPKELEVFGKFEAHAIAFAASAEKRQDSAPMFPKEFAQMLER